MSQTETPDAPTGFVGRLAARPLWQRVLVFSSIVFLVIAFFYALTAFFVYQSAISVPRATPVVLNEAIEHSEYVTFDDPDTFPGAVAVDDNGTLYVGSYGMGAVWAAMGPGDAQMLAGTREQIGSIAGLDVGPDGSLYILDRIAPVQAQGATIWRYREGNLESVITFPTQGRTAVQVPNDIAIDAAGNIYMVDFALQQVWQVTPEGEAVLWWQLPPDADADRAAPAGLAYDAANDRLLIADGGADVIYGVSLAEAEAPLATVYAHSGDEPLGLNGLDVTQAGVIYASALTPNRVARIDDAETVTFLAEAFRGSGDVAYVDGQQRLFVTNWDQSWLLPVRLLFVAFDVDARLPFSVDVLSGDI